jgi:hypothetical protein
MRTRDKVYSPYLGLAVLLGLFVCFMGTVLGIGVLVVKLVRYLS